MMTQILKLKSPKDYLSSYLELVENCNEVCFTENCMIKLW